MKFLFLDFDGVLHPDNVFQSREHGLELVGPGSLLMHAPILETILDDLDPNGYIWIVLSTSWVKAVGHDKTLSYLSSGLADRVTDLTMECLYDSAQLTKMNRYQLIRGYLNRRSHEDWLAIDDLHSGTHPWPDIDRDHLVLTDPNKGLGYPAAQQDLKQKLERMLSK